MKIQKEYPYTYARVSAMKSRLYKKGDYDKFQKLTVGEIVKQLGDGEYKKEVDKYAVSKKGLELIEYALLENTSNTYKKLKRISDFEIKELIDAFLIRNDIHNMKTILRGKNANKSIEKIQELLISATKINGNFYPSLMKQDSTEKIIEKFTFINKEVHRIALQDYKETKSLMFIENALDKYMYEEMLKVADQIEHPSIKDFLRTEIKNANIKTILKFKKAKKETKDVIELLIRPKQKTISLAEKSYDEAIKSLQKRNKNISENILETEAQIDKETIQKVSKLLHQKPLSADIIIGYLFAKEIEMRNLRLIIKAKEFNLPIEFVESQLVIA